jgi:hypothetical protein
MPLVDAPAPATRATAAAVSSGVSPGGDDVAVFERGGRTCVIAGHVIHLSTLLELAAWKAGGRIRS